MSLPRVLRTILVLGRVSNLPTVWTNVIAGWFLSGGEWSPELGWIIAGISLFYVAGMTLNDAADAHWDEVHAPERPIPSGAISRTAVLVLGIVQFGLGIAILLSQTTVHPLLWALLVVAILLYTWLHKRWKGSVLLMGLCRSLVYLGAGSAVVVQSESIEVPGILYVVAGAVVLYVAGITLAARSEHLANPTGISFLNRIFLMLPVLFPLFAYRTVPSTTPHLALVIVGVFGIWSWLVLTRTALREKVPKGIAFAIAGIAFYDAALVAFADWRAAVVCLACFVLTLGAQRVIPAT